MLGYVGSNLLRAVLRPFTTAPSPTAEAANERAAAFALWDSYYHNTAYERTADGGFRDTIVTALGTQAARDIFGLYNPVARAVDFYRHTLAGNFGDEITLDPQHAAAGLLRPLNSGLTPPAQVWAWSNLNQSKRLLTQYAANLGTCGLRIVAQNHADVRRRRVWLKPEHPRLIRDVDLDTRGNVTGIVLRYEEITGLGDQQRVVTIQEEQTKTDFRFYEVGIGGALTPLADRSGPNDLGVVPYVLLWHQPTGGAFGQNCYYRIRGALDRYNALLTHLDTQIHDHVNATWLIAGAGDPPVSMDIGGRNVLYFNTRGGDAPDATALVANLGLRDSLDITIDQKQMIANELPELKATDGQWLSGQSGETIAELRKPAEDALRDARDSYEDGLVRGTQIALSWGVLLGLWDLGAGMGDAAAADRSYHDGFEDFRFNRRPLLTTAQPAPVSQPPAGARAQSAAARQEVAV